MDVPPYWDPLPTLAAADPDCLNGAWLDRHWLNVPGPFYTGETEGWLGRIAAPRHVVYDSFGSEIIYRQPRTPEEVRDLLEAAAADSLGGYAADGDTHWTVTGVRDWWRERERLTRWIHDTHQPWERRRRHDPVKADAAAGLASYLAYVDGELAGDLRAYAFWLDNGRPHRPGEHLPDL